MWEIKTRGGEILHDRLCDTALCESYVQHDFIASSFFSISSGERISPPVSYDPSRYTAMAA